MATRVDIPPPLETTQADTSFFGHPRGLATLFFTEMWERFSYYGMRALLILFMVAPVSKGGLGFGVAKAGAVYGLYTAMVYLLCLPGGWVADRIIGQRKAVLYGGIFIVLGEFCLVAPSELTFYVGLVLLMIGTGLLKPNVSTIVGQLYAHGDIRRDSGFSIFYMGINIGALVSPLACGWVAEQVSWRLGFGLAGIGMIAGLVQYVMGDKHLGTAGLHPAPGASPAADSRQKRNGAIGTLAALALFAVVGILAATGSIDLTPESISNALGIVLIVLAVAVFSWLLLGKGWTVEERKRSGAILVLFLGSAVFWSVFEQAGSSLSLFAERSVSRHIGSFEFPASWFQSVQPILVIALAPVFAWLWLVLGPRQPSSPTKFTLGLLMAGLGFAILVPVAAATQVSPWWLTGTYFIHTLGELCLSPVGLSSMTKLAPARLGGFVMGMWFVSTAIGNYMAGRVASLYESMALPTLFGTVALFAIAGAIVLALVIKPTVRLMSGVK
jgi:POT family proton-dependent oligopeptide transporter